MNKKVYIAPDIKVVMIETLELLAESIPVYETDAENSMESKFGFIFDDDEL